MGSGHVEGAEAAEGLRTAVGFYTTKAERLGARLAELKAKLEELQAELAKASTARDQLEEALREITGERASPEGEPGQVADSSEVAPAGDRTALKGGTGSSRRTSPRQDVASAGSVEKNVELWREVLQVLATSGRPMRVKEIAAALGRPTKGKTGTSAVETVRSTCKRQVKHGRAVEGPAGVFEIARGQEAVWEGAA